MIRFELNRLQKDTEYTSNSLKYSGLTDNRPGINPLHPPSRHHLDVQLELRPTRNIGNFTVEMISWGEGHNPYLNNYISTNLKTIPKIVPYH